MISSIYDAINKTSLVARMICSPTSDSCLLLHLPLSEFLVGAAPDQLARSRGRSRRKGSLLILAAQPDPLVLGPVPPAALLGLGRQLGVLNTLPQAGDLTLGRDGQDGGRGLSISVVVRIALWIRRVVRIACGSGWWSG